MRAATLVHTGFVLALAIWASDGRAAPSLNLGRPDANASQCEHMQMQADEASCDKSVCHLAGGASIQCDSLLLWGDTIDLHLDEQQQFAGAEARGNVLLVENLTVTRCQAITLDADRVRGQIDAANIEIRRSQPPPSIDPNGVPQGRNQAVIHGDLRRLDPNRLRIEHGNLTLCDCGEDEAPSWRVDAPGIDVELGHRATIWWPHVRVHAWGDFMLPVLPPMLPLSLPLNKRAMGFLPPHYTFFSAWPTLDFPFFIPLGPSWDVTLTPGARMDWSGPDGRGIRRLGAPRLGARVRYAPVEGTLGQINAQWTYDGWGGLAAQVLSQARMFNPAWLDDPINADQYAQRAQLENRISVDWEHRSRLRPRLDWLVDAHWLSDDLVNQDFQIAPAQRVAAYLPSRTELILREPRLSALLSMDAMQRLDSSKMLGGVRVADISNLHGAERTTLHRAPLIDVNLLPVPLGAGMMADAQGTFVRYGNWSGAAPETPTDVSQTLVGLAAGVGFARRAGSVEFNARAGVDSLVVDTDGLPSFITTAPLLNADATVRLGRRFGDMLHVIAPQIRYRGVPTVWASSNLGERAQVPALDERLLRRRSEQGLLVLQQSLWHAGDAHGTPLVSLALAQPWDLESGDILQPWAQLTWSAPYVGQASAWTSIDPHRSDSDPVREIGLSWRVPVGPLGFEAEYNRLSPDADRFTRSIYELAAPRLPPSPIANEQSQPEWAHILRAGAHLRYKERVSVGYATAYQLPRPGHESDPTYIDPACRDPNGGGARHCFTQHVVTAGYNSPCDCWGINTTVTLFPQDMQHPRFEVSLTVADYKIGTGFSTQAH